MRSAPTAVRGTLPYLRVDGRKVRTGPDALDQVVVAAVLLHLRRSLVREHANVLVALLRIQPISARGSQGTTLSATAEHACPGKSASPYLAAAARAHHGHDDILGSHERQLQGKRRARRSAQCN